MGAARKACRTPEELIPSSFWALFRPLLRLQRSARFITLDFSWCMGWGAAQSEAAQLCEKTSQPGIHESPQPLCTPHPKTLDAWLQIVWSRFPHLRTQNPTNCVSVRVLKEMLRLKQPPKKGEAAYSQLRQATCTEPTDLRHPSSTAPARGELLLLPHPQETIIYFLEKKRSSSQNATPAPVSPPSPSGTDVRGTLRLAPTGLVNHAWVQV